MPGGLYGSGGSFGTSGGLYGKSSGSGGGLYGGGGGSYGAPKKKKKGKSWYGGLKNVVHDIEDIAVGSVVGPYQIGKGALQDTRDVIQGGFRPRQGNKVQPFPRTTQVGKGIAKQYADYYGPLTHGDVDKFLDNVYEHPLNLALDAATVASLGIGGAAKAGVISAKGGKVLELTMANGEKIVTKPLARGEMRAQIQALTARAKNAPVKVGPYERPAGMQAAKVKQTQLARATRNKQAQNAAFNRELRKLRGQPAKVAAFLHGRFDRQALDEYMGILRAGAKDDPKGPAAATLKVLENPRVQKLFDNPTPKVTKVIDEARGVGAAQAKNLKLAPETVESARYRPARIAGGARLKDGEWVGGPSIEELKARGLDPVYFPDVDNVRQPVLSVGGGGGKGIPGRVGSQRQNTGALMLAGQLVHDPSVLNRSFLDSVKYSHYQDTHKALLDMASEADHIPSGYEAIREVRKEHVSHMDATRDEFLKAIDSEGTFRKDAPALTTASPSTAQRLANGNYLVVPSKVVKQMTGEFTKTNDFVRIMNRYPLKVWRALVLGLRPAWLVNNVVGNTLMYAVHSARPEDLRQLAGAFKEFAKPSHHKAIDQLLNKHFAGQTQGGFVAAELPEFTTRNPVLRAGAAVAGFLPKIDKRWEQALRKAKVKAELKRNPELKAKVEQMGTETSLFEHLAANPDDLGAVLDSPARQQFEREISSRFSPEETADIMAMTDMVAAYGARSSGTHISQAYDRFQSGVTGAEAEAGALAQVAAPDVRYSDKHTASKLRSKLNPRKGTAAGVPRTPDLWATAPNGQRFKLAGDITPEDWVQRVKAVVPDAAARDDLARWYEHYEPMFRAAFGEDADAIMRGFAVSQANASPSSGLQAVLKVMDKLRAGEQVGPNEISVVGQQIAQAVRNEAITKGVAAKLSDFINSLEGTDTRTWMGNHPQGGSPVAVDVHAIRDRGFVDQKQVARLKKQFGFTRDKDYKVESTGTATGPLYERIAEWYHGVTDHLNEINFDGRSDWTPAQAQALGWSTIQIAQGVLPEGFAEAFARNSREISFELTQGPSGLGNDLTLEQTRQVADAMKSAAEELARATPGLYFQKVERGVGGWNQGVNSNLNVTVIGSRDAVQASLERFAQAFDQEWVQASRDVTGKDSRATLIIDSPAFKSEEEMGRFFAALNRIEPKLEGFMPYDVQGTPGIAIRTNHPNVSPKTVDKFLARYEDAVQKAEAETGLQVGYNGKNVELLTGGQHGAEAPVHTLPGSGGRRAALDDPLAARIRQQLEAEIERVRGAGAAGAGAGAGRGRVEPRILGKEAWDAEPREGYVYHGTSPQNAERILEERRVRVGQTRQPEAAWFSKDPKAAAFFGDKVFEFPESVLPESAQEARFGAIGSPEDVLFQGQRGAFDPGTRLIHLFDQADPSTAIHEFLHAVETGGGLTEEHIGVLEQWSGHQRGTREFSEATAQGFEQYLREGKAPTPQLNSLFARWKDLLTRLYQKATQLGAPITDSVRGVFDEILAPKAQAPLDDVGKIDRVLSENPDIANAIYDRVNDALGNFDFMSPAERSVMRSLFPFYSWFKAIAGVSGKLVLEQPLKVNLMAHLGNMAIESALEEQGIPRDEWPSSLVGMVGMHKDSDGRISGINLTPSIPYMTVAQLGAFAAAVASFQPGEAGRTLPGLNPLLTDLGSYIWGQSPQGYEVHGIGTVESLPFVRLLKAFEATYGHDLPLIRPASTNDPMYDHYFWDEVARYSGFPYARVSKTAAKRTVAPR